MATTKQVSDLIVKLMRVNTSHALVADLTELQRQFRGVESDMKLAENKAAQLTIDNAKLKKEIETLKKQLQAAPAQPAAQAGAATTPGRVAVGFEWKTQK